jgi:hypothetical protein
MGRINRGETAMETEATRLRLFTEWRLGKNFFI